MQIELTEAGRAARNAYQRKYRAQKREEERNRVNKYWNRKGALQNGSKTAQLNIK